MGRKLVSLNITSMFTPENTGGVATHINYLTESLRKLKTSERHDVHVVSVHNEEKDSPTLSGAKPNLHVHKIKGSKSHFDASGSIPYEKAIRYCMGLCNNQTTRPDVIHVHDFEGVHIGALLKAVYGIPLVLTVHKTPKEWDKSEVYQEPKNFHLQAITQLDIFDFFVAPSNAYKQHLLDHGIKDDKIEIIHHGVPAQYLSGQNDPSVFTRLNIDRDKNIIFCPIRLDKHKAPDIFIEAAAIVLNVRENDNLLFVIAGNGSSKYTEQLVNLATKLGVMDHLVMGPSDGIPPSLSEMASLYRQAKICVLPSRREGFGQVILESFIFNTPLIGSNVGGISEIIIPEINGLLFNRDEPEHLARQIIRLLDDKELVKKLVKNGKEDVKNKFDSKLMAKRYFELYKKCRNNSRGEKKGRSIWTRPFSDGLDP